MRVESLIARLIRRIEEEGRAAGAVRVSEIRLLIGECAGVESRTLLTVFDRESRGTLAHGAMLRIQRVALEAKCDSCGSRFGVVHFCFECPYCFSRRTRVVAGEELVLESVVLVIEGDPSLGCLH
jgi:hydrogenase nickel incorporation protein HypA/HybF